MNNMKNIYLVDIENVQTKFLDIIPSMMDIDILILFVLEDNHNLYIPIDHVINICRKNIDLRLVDCFRGQAKKNALDFQLVSHLGNLIANNQPDTNYIIYTNDLGFDPVIKFWQDKGVKIDKYYE